MDEAIKPSVPLGAANVPSTGKNMLTERLQYNSALAIVALAIDEPKSHCDMDCVVVHMQAACASGHRVKPVATVWSSIGAPLW